jgi:DNA-nicking Smr family endonuclease
VRSLSADEKALWDQVAATIRPLSREPVKPAAANKVEQPKTVQAAPAARPPLSPKVEPLRKPAAGQTLDSSWDRRLRSGSVEPDRILDLHGLTLDRAWSAIDRGLETAIAQGDRVVLLITGHARSSDPPVQRGKIRAAVHDWLAASRHAPKIAAVRNAHGRHGGGGSLYIILRRNRPGSTFS